MERRDFLTVATLAGCVVVAGCAGTGRGRVEQVPSTGTPEASTETESETESTPEASEESTGNLSAPPVHSTGRGVGTSQRFTALGGPVIVALTFDYAGMRNSNFIVEATDSVGEAVSPKPLFVNELLAPGQLKDDTGRYSARLVTRFEPGDYFISVGAAGGPYGDGEWEVVVEQPGVPTTGEPLPVTVEGYDADVVGPVALGGPTRVTVETLESALAFDGEPTSYNYWVEPVDATGQVGSRIANSVEAAPTTQSAVWFAEGDVGYFNVHSRGPWRATVETA